MRFSCYYRLWAPATTNRRQKDRPTHRPKEKLCAHHTTRAMTFTPLYMPYTQGCWYSAQISNIIISSIIDKWAWPLKTERSPVTQSNPPPPPPVSQSNPPPPPPPPPQQQYYHGNDAICVIDLKSTIIMQNRNFLNPKAIRTGP